MPGQTTEQMPELEIVAENIPEMTPETVWAQAQQHLEPLATVADY